MLFIIYAVNMNVSAVVSASLARVPVLLIICTPRVYFLVVSRPETYGMFTSKAPLLIFSGPTVMRETGFPRKTLERAQISALIPLHPCWHYDR